MFENVNFMAGGVFLTQIISLIKTFTSERVSGKIDQKLDILTWLETNNHEEARRLLETDSQALKDIQTLLNESQEVLLGRLKEMDELLARIASRVDGFGAIARAVWPGIEPSEQAISILRQLDKSRAGGFTGDAFGGIPAYYFVEGARGRLEFSEPRFLTDDLDTLTRMNLLLKRPSPGGKSVYMFTRAGSQYVRLLGPQAPE